jgi:hypothetical protein
MRNLAKLIIISVFGLGALFIFLSGIDLFGIGSAVWAQVAFNPKPTPTNTTSNTNAVTLVQTTPSDKTMAKTFTLGKDSFSEYGEVAFSHSAHAFQNYSPDGKSVVGCAECHHTDQPKSALKPPLSTSERDGALTLDVWKASAQKVNECRTCHFQDGNVADGKTMPSATYTVGGKTTTKELTNELAYHINCNTCHDAAVKIRPELKKNSGFPTAKDCTVCHKTN